MSRRTFEIAKKINSLHPAELYYALRFLRTAGLGLHAVVYAPFLESIGVDRTQILLLNVLFLIIVFLMELPTGMLADGKSRAWSVQAGTLLIAVSMVIYGFAQGFWSALVGEMIIGIGLAFISGAEQAWITDALIKRGEKERLAHVFGTASLIHSSGMILSGLACVALMQYSFRAPWIMGGVIVGLAFIFSLAMNGKGEPVQRIKELEAFRQSLSAMRRSNNLKWIVGAVWIFALVIPFNYWWSLFFRSRTPSAYFGLVWIPMYLGAAVAGAWIRKRGIPEKSEAHYLLVSMILGGASLALIAQFPGLALPLAVTIMHEIARGLFNPAVETFMQRRVESSYRATYGSLQQFLASIGSGSLLFVIWLMARNFPADDTLIAIVWSVSGLTLLGVIVPWWLLRPRKN